MNRWRWAARALGAAGLVVLLAGCADEDPAFDPTIIPDAVRAEVEPIGIVAVACEGSAPESPGIPTFGGRFECAGELNGDPVVLDVEAVPAVDGTIEVVTDVRTPLFDVAVAESAGAARLAAELGGEPEIDCAERLVVVAPGREIACRVTAAGGTAGPVDRALTIVILDTNANWEIDLFG